MTPCVQILSKMPTRAPKRLDETRKNQEQGLHLKVETERINANERIPSNKSYFVAVVYGFCVMARTEGSLLLRLMKTKHRSVITKNI